jgi:hypothetical protein
MADKNFKKHYIGEKGWQFRSICEVLREIYWETEDPVIRKKVVEATAMAKKMGMKLVDNKFDYYDTMEYDAIEDPESVVAERYAKYKAEVERLIEHKIDKGDDDE